MKKMVGAMVCGALAMGLALGAETVPGQAALDKKAQQRETMLRHTGGLLTIDGKGKFGIVNLQNRVAAAEFEGEAAKLAKTLRVKVEASVAKGAFTVEGAVKLLKEGGYNAAVLVVDEPRLPMSLAAIEQHWTMVNVAALAVDQPDAAKLLLRTRKMVQRGATLAYGGTCSQYKASPMQNVSTVADLDKAIGEVMTFDAVGAIHKNMEKLGVTMSRITTYRKACQEGWAAAPTNDYQKAIFEQVKADKEKGPTNPIKIVPPKKQ